MERWEAAAALDVDESDLPSLLRPCKRLHHHQTLTPSNQPNTKNTSSSSSSSSSPSRIIPGPAAQVQAAMLRKSQDRHNYTPQTHIIPTQEYIAKAVEHHHSEFDHHFQSDPWISALHFLGVVDGVIPSTPLSSIRNRLEVPKVDRVVAVIKSCTPNGFGGLMVTLKDPTGMLDASIHHKVLSESEFGKDLLIGSVVILQKVAVFAPSRTACYLNITLRNMVKVFKMDRDLNLDRDLAIKQVNASYKFVAPEKDCGGETSRLDAMSFSELGTNKDIQEDERSYTIMRPYQNDSQREKENEVPRNSSCQNEVSINQTLAKIKFSSSGQNATSAVFEELPAEENVDCGTTDASNSGAETQRASGVQNPTQPLLARTSLPQYTDEQLLLLFASGEDDDFVY